MLTLSGDLMFQLDLKDVTVDQVLEVIRDVYGYEYQLRSGIYTIYPRKLRTQVTAVAKGKIRLIY